MSRQGLRPSVSRCFDVAAEEAAEKWGNFVIPSGARNPSGMESQENKEGFLAPLGMTRALGDFFRDLRSRDPQNIFMRWLLVRVFPGTRKLSYASYGLAVQQKSHPFR